MCFQSIKGLTGNINNIHFNFLTVTKMFHTFGPVIYKTENGTCSLQNLGFIIENFISQYCMIFLWKTIIPRDISN
jgi:hypothetical protein